MINSGEIMEESFFRKEEKKPGATEIPGLDNSTHQYADQSSFDKDRGLIAAILSYIPFLCLIPLLQMRDNEQARFHGKQGFLLFMIELVAGIFLIPGLSGMFWRMVLILSLGASIAGIIFGYQGRQYKLPLIGDIAEKIKL